MNDYPNQPGVAEAFPALDTWDVRQHAGKQAAFNVTEGHSPLAFVLDGDITINDGSKLSAAQMAVLPTAGLAFQMGTAIT